MWPTTAFVDSPTVEVEDDEEGFDLIQPTLIQQLRKILDEYPDDGQILKVGEQLYWISDEADKHAVSRRWDGLEKRYKPRHSSFSNRVDDYLR